MLSIIYTIYLMLSYIIYVYPSGKCKLTLVLYIIYTYPFGNVIYI